MRFGSLFAGVGCFDLGLEQAGMTCAWQVEIDPGCQKVLAQHWPDVPRYDDVKDVHDLEPVDLVVGGFPCQGISTAGRRHGLDDPRSALWWEFHRIIKQVEPKWVLIENVAGLLTSGHKPGCNGGCVATHGGDLGAILGSLGDLGYGFAYRVLDSRWFGVPQRRRRVFIVGCLGDAASAAHVLFEPEVSSGDSAPREEPAARFDQSVEEAGGVMTFRKSRRAISDKDYETWVPDTNTNTLNRFDGSVTRTTTVVADEMGARRLTPREWERLQGLPDDWTAALAPSFRYAAVGNGGAVPVVRWIGERING